MCPCIKVVTFLHRTMAYKYKAITFVDLFVRLILRSQSNLLPAFANFDRILYESFKTLWRPLSCLQPVVGNINFKCIISTRFLICNGRWTVAFECLVWYWGICSGSFIDTVFSFYGQPHYHCRCCIRGDLYLFFIYLIHMSVISQRIAVDL